MIKVVALLALAGFCLANNPYQPAYKPSYKEPAYAEPKYAFDWTVKDDYSYNHYGQSEKRDGYSTDGSYFVLLPDGRTQTVKYYVNGDSGYVAEVTYSGEPKYDTYKASGSSYRPSYSKPAYAPAPYYQA